MSLSDILNLEQEKTKIGYNPSDPGGFGESALSSFNQAVFGEIDRRRKLKETQASEEFQIRKLETMFGQKEKLAGLGIASREKIARIGAITKTAKEMPPEFTRLSKNYDNLTKQLVDPVTRLPRNYDDLAPMVGSQNKLVSAEGTRLLTVWKQRQDIFNRMQVIKAKMPIIPTTTQTKITLTPGITTMSEAVKDLMEQGLTEQEARDWIKVNQ